MTKWLSPASSNIFRHFSGQDPCRVLGSHPGGGEKRVFGPGGGLVLGEAMHRLWEQLAHSNSGCDTHSVSVSPLSLPREGSCRN